VLARRPVRLAKSSGGTNGDHGRLSAARARP
jgi:hypothetical protein